MSVRENGPPGSVHQNGNIIRLRLGTDSGIGTQMAGYRCPDYFPEWLNESVFNMVKYLLYFRCLEAKGYLTLRNTEIDNNGRNTEFHESVHVAKSRSRAGACCQTREAHLVVSVLDLGNLLSSVIPVLRQALI